VAREIAVDHDRSETSPADQIGDRSGLADPHLERDEAHARSVPED
jgi:hypothetical protein